jgi:drug/metabolite transporter (DMT)-like permease
MYGYFMQHRTSAYIAAVFNALFIGLSFLFVKESLAAAEPFTTLAFRFTLSFVFMLLLLAAGVIAVHIPRDVVRDLLILSFIQPVLFFSLQAFGMLSISSSESGIISAFVPVFVGILGLLLLGERVNAKQFLAFFISIAGIACLFWMGGSQGAGASWIGMVLTLLSALATSLYIVLGRRLTRTLDPVSLTFGMMLCGCVAFVAAAVGCEGLDAARAALLLGNPDFMLDILYLGLFTSVGTSFLAMYSLKYLEAAKVGIIQNLSVVVSILAGVLVLQETFLPCHAIGSFLIIAGVVLANFWADQETEP